MEVAERFADGLATAKELRSARLACQGAGGSAAWYAAATNPEIAARNAAHSAQSGVALFGAEAAERVAQAALLRDIFGPLPFRPVVRGTHWLTPAVLHLSNPIYEARAFDRMLSLADALQEAGCDNDEILGHCRGRGPHVRGCFVLDLIRDVDAPCLRRENDSFPDPLGWIWGSGPIGFVHSFTHPPLPRERNDAVNERLGKTARSPEGGST